MTETMRLRWNQRYRDADPAAARAATVLSENIHLLPRAGQALDLAAGLGGNALLLAAHGLQVTAWDIAETAMNKLADYARHQGLPIRAEARDVVATPPPPESFDVIVVSRFLERGLAQPLCRSLRPGGLLFYQTFSREAVTDSGPGNPEFRLGANELLELFGPLQVVFYREEGRLGDLSHGLRDEAQLIARRPHSRH